ncbi:hypothetical protein DIT68_10870 [Brumimicrobium oceani]|uniref:Uncharacterized protein n=1 Tax=Brumimicrobium oceani TaxID=2100725 RepID=A0A2U2XBK2_9FLAO|nr:hypothetical protein DIT68_10870 [Brumimicrobium oceani]
MRILNKTLLILLVYLSMVGLNSIDRILIKNETIQVSDFSNLMLESLIYASPLILFYLYQIVKEISR